MLISIGNKRPAKGRKGLGTASLHQHDEVDLMIESLVIDVGFSNDL
jgi:hypothetical protein